MSMTVTMSAMTTGSEVRMPAPLSIVIWAARSVTPIRTAEVPGPLWIGNELKPGGVGQLPLGDAVRWLNVWFTPDEAGVPRARFGKAVGGYYGGNVFDAGGHGCSSLGWGW